MGPDLVSARPVAVDLFSGAGGMSLGFEQAGFDVLAAIERDPAHAAVHRFNFPLCQVLEADMASLTLPKLEAAIGDGAAAHGRARDVPQIDVLFGGPPCQGFSVGGRLDAADPRNRMLQRFAWAVEALRPRAFVIENVPAMASRTLRGCTHPVLRWLEARLARSGYTIRLARVLNASHYGIPQDRRRLLVVGSLRAEGDVCAPPPSVAPVTKRPWDPARPGDWGHERTSAALVRGPTVADALEDLPDLDGFDELLESDVLAAEIVAAHSTGRGRSSYAASLAGDDIDSFDLSAPRTGYEAGQLTSSLRTVHTTETRQRFEATDKGEFEPTSRFYRLHEEGLSGTLRAGSASEHGSFSAPRPIHYKHARVISVREAARLHGFPDWFRFSVAKWHGFRQVGNAVPPPLARAIAVEVRRSLGEDAVPRAEAMELGDPHLLKVPSGAGRRPPSRRRHRSDRVSAQGRA